MAAVALKRRLPSLTVRALRSPEIGIIGVGEVTTVSFPKFFFDYLKLQPKSFYELADPTWKLGVRFLWGPRKQFYYSFGYEFQHRYPDLARNNGFYPSVMEDGAGKRWTADLYIDASGFRSEILGRTLQESYVSYADTLFCDRAVIGGWPRTTEPVLPYTTAETMDAGWCWQIEHEHFINRGYVYASSFISDEEALREFRTKNPRIANEPRVVKFRTGRYTRNWVGNVVAVGNAVGFVEPLEATALQVICVQISSLADSLADCVYEPTASLIDLYNRFNAQAWDDIRDFLSVHYVFNTRLDTPFWVACRHDVQMHGAKPLVNFFQENGPSILSGAQMLHPSNSFGMDGYLTLLLGQDVPHAKPYSPPAREMELWRQRSAKWHADAQRGLTVPECLAFLRKHGYK